MTRGEQLFRVREGHHAQSRSRVEARSEALGSSEERLGQRAYELLVRELKAEAERPGLPRVPLPSGGSWERGTGAWGAEREGVSPLDAVGPGIQVRAGADRTAAADAGGEAASARVESLVSLIERIDVLVRAGQPALALSVGGRLDAEVDVERTGRGEIAVWIRGRREPPSAALLDEVRQGLLARGLRVSALHASGPPSP